MNINIIHTCIKRTWYRGENTEYLLQDYWRAFDVMLPDAEDIMITFIMYMYIYLFLVVFLKVIYMCDCLIKFQFFEKSK